MRIEKRKGVDLIEVPATELEERSVKDSFSTERIKSGRGEKGKV